MLLPGFYLATKKYFLVIVNKKFNIFPIRLLFTIPAGIMFSFLVTLISVLIFGLFLKFILPFDDYFPILLILSSLFVTFSFKKYFIRNDLPPEYDPNFMNYELYVYMPLQKIPQNEYNRFGIPPGIRLGKDLFVGIQKEDLKLHFKSLQGNDIVFTEFGEIVVSDKALSIFSKYGFNDLFGTRHVQAISVKLNNHLPYNLNEKYYQLLSTSVMLPLDPKTEIKKVIANFSTRHYVVDNKFYYNRKIMENISDFNVTFEILGANDGSPYRPQKLWIVTNKAMEFLLTEFDQQKRDFIPVMLVDDEMENF
jgi:hypothetical protein